MFRLAHISDPHIGPLPDFEIGDLTFKQRLGHLNWRKARARTFDQSILAAVLADMKSAQPDHIVVTGDVINLGLSAEIERAREWLEGLGSVDEITVVPGNHDAYVPSAVADYADKWQAFMRGDGLVEGYPTLRIRENVALIGVSTAMPTAPLMASGRAGSEQLAKLARDLESTGDDGMFRIILIHHRPDAGVTPWHKRLIDAAQVRKVIAQYGAELVLHGHDHRNRRAIMEGPTGDVPVIGVAATALRPTGNRAGGSWNLLAISRHGTAHEIMLSTRAWCNAGGITTITEERLTA